MHSVVFLDLLGSAACGEPAERGYSGTWVMNLDSRPLVVLTLEESGGGFAGTLVRPRTMSSDGPTVSGIGGDVLSERVTATAQGGAILRIVAVDPDDPADKTEYEFTLDRPDDAGLRPSGAPFEPWPFRRHDGAKPPHVWTGWDSRRAYAIQAPSAAPNAEMAAIYRSDQADRKSAEAFYADAERIGRHDAVRRDRTRALLEAGELRAAEDFRLAALVFQHGSQPDDFLLAHTLALVSLSKGDRSAAWIAAASMDRYLHSIDRSQIFGTQFGRDGSSQEPFDATLVSDALRRELGVPDRAVQHEQLRKIPQSLKQQ
jgi:hypothetical protein